VLDPSEAGALLDIIDTSIVVGVRDRALIRPIEITLTQQLQRRRERFERYGTIPIAMLPMPTTLVVRSKVGTL
jgi:hypothetical protein